MTNRKQSPAAAIIGAVAAIAALAFTFQAFHAVQNVNTTEPTPVASSESTVAPLDSSVTDGQFTFSAGLLQCGQKVVAGNKPIGAFCVLPVTIANTGAESQYVALSEQVLYDESGRKYTPDTSVMYDLDNATMSLNDLNPGLSVKIRLVYDMPKGVLPVVAEFHDSMLSGGERVQV